MGLGSNTPTIPAVDLMESSIIQSPHNASQRFCNIIYKHVIKNRDMLGFPKGSGESPYLFVSNDLCTKFMNAFALFEKHIGTKGYNRFIKDVPNILALLKESYDDENHDGCCGFWHSIPKDVLAKLSESIPT